LQNSFHNDLKTLSKIFTITLLIGLTSFNMSGGTWDEKKPDDDKKGKKAKDDTTAHAHHLDKSLMEQDEDGLLAESDTTIISFPSNDLYASWDTIMAHPYRFSDCFKADSVEIDFINPGEHCFVMPFRGPVTSEFGWRKRRPHYGTDIDLETGDSVVAAFDGMIRIAKVCSGYGNCIIIRHNNGLETVYAHLSKIDVEVGQVVKAGESIGLGGNTGRSTGSHLYWEIRYLGQALDATDIVDFKSGELKDNCFVLRKTDVATKYDLRALHSRHRKDAGLTKAEIAHAQKMGYGKIYKVKSGDTLGAIAKRHKTTVAAICKKNRIKETSILKLGQILKI